jgi:3-hydroxyacyl-CoA dehydrogenase/enoyl-CoA hydratase/3-hydroxybutyryl-CoA epimerase
MQTWPPANAIYRRETHDNYPAAKAILQSVYEGLQLPMDRALTVESRYFAKILRSKEAAAMIRTLFLSMQELNKGARRPADVPATSLKKVGIVGAGFMGKGIAYVTASAGMEVVLIDQSQEAAESGRAFASELITKQINRGKAKTADRDALVARIHPTTDYAELKGCDLVIEAVFEDPKVKADVIAKVEAAIGKDVIFGSNTSTLPISGLAEQAQRPKQFIGIHFFSPVEKMLLVEVIMGKKTGDKALAVALDYIRAIKKTPIVVNDARGFYANRCVGAYIREGHLMLAEGVPPAMIENVAKMAGMPVGPLSLNDEVAIDLGLKIMKATEAQLGAEAVNPVQKALLVEMVEKRGRLGRKNKKGFYDYPEDKGEKRLWPGLAELQTTKLDPDAIDIAEMKERFLVAQAIEAARSVEEKVITDPREADVGSIIGFGFAPYTGGTLSYIDGMGAAAFLALCKKLQKKYGERFKAPRIITKMAKDGSTFYAPAKAAETRQAA